MLKKLKSRNFKNAGFGLGVITGIISTLIFQYLQQPVILLLSKTVITVRQIEPLSLLIGICLGGLIVAIIAMILMTIIKELINNDNDNDYNSYEGDSDYSEREGNHGNDSNSDDKNNKDNDMDSVVGEDKITDSALTNLNDKDVKALFELLRGELSKKEGEKKLYCESGKSDGTIDTSKPIAATISFVRSKKGKESESGNSATTSQEEGRRRWKAMD